MRQVTYHCDVCKRQYSYMLAAGDDERGVLYKFKNFELCNQCVKLTTEFIKSLCQQKNQQA